MALFEENQNAPRPSEHTPVKGKIVVLRKIRTHLDLLSIPRLGRKNVKTFRWDQRLQIQNLFMAFKRVARWK